MRNTIVLAVGAAALILAGCQEMVPSTDRTPETPDALTSSVPAVALITAPPTIDTEGDRDWFAVELESGRTYVFYLEGDGTQGGTLHDHYLGGIYDATGILLAGTRENDGGEARNSRLTYTAAQNGTHYVSASAYAGTGTYALSVADVTPGAQQQREPAQQQESDDLPADTTTTGVVATDGSTTSTIGTAGDVDWFAVTLAADTTYIIDVEGRRSGLGTLDHPLLSGIYDSTGAVVAPADRDGTLRPGRVFFSPSADGTYYLATSGVGESTGSYTLTVTSVADIPANTTTTARVPVNNGRWGYIETPGDTDWFEVTLDAGTSYRIDLQGLDFGLGELVDTKLISIRDSNGAVVADTEADSGGRGQDARLDFVPDTSGRYYIEAGSANETTGYYVVSVAADDYAADSATTGVVTLQDGSGTVTGNIERAYDSDWFGVALERGTSYWIDLEGSTTGAGTLDETLLSIILPEDETYGGATNFAGNAEGGNSRFQFTARSDGPYYLAVRAWQGGTGTYTLSVRALTEGTDVPADTTTTAEIAPGDGFQGTIGEEGDTDWIGIQLVTGTTYTFTLIGSQSIGSGKTLADPEIVSVRDDDGAVISGSAQNARLTYIASGQAVELTFTAARTGLHHIEIGSGSGTGSYRLDVRTDDYAANTATSGVVTDGTFVTGVIEVAYERDWFAATLEEGTTYQFDLEGDGGGGRASALTDPYLRGIYDSSGTRQAGTDDDDSGSGNNSVSPSRPQRLAPTTYPQAAMVGAPGRTHCLFRQQAQIPPIPRRKTITARPREVCLWAVLLRA